ncbi:unnamed protein product [marine sediment metagenome]|uniref:Uncharacterized protein n=1 Tax=marine sediment metagenome TaxID=412755 RepID=X0TPD4_9ZZZZ
MQTNIWITVGDQRVCPTCEDKDGEIKTIAGWETEGWPGGGADICGDRCRCICVPDGYVAEGLREMSRFNRIRTLENLGLTRIRAIPGSVLNTMVRLGYDEVMIMSATDLKTFYMEHITGISASKMQTMTLRSLANKFYQQEGIEPLDFNF